MNYTQLEDVLVAITVFSMFMAVPLAVLVVAPVRPPYLYRLARVNCRLFVRYLHRTPL